ncbi:peptidoglycan-binding domain-containing protein [Streptomyces sp. enrichment culture]|uniref:peptidoglycan-binding domain-containing protein n=1 Tax=Streptomyces sp. enrichment culture TaxID=1795815 RepID=UPI003F556E94
MATPPGPRSPHDGPPLEPIRVLRPRRTDALAELFREFEQDTAAGYEAVSVPRADAEAEAETRELPPVPPAAAGRDRLRAPSHSPGQRRAAVVIATAAAAVLGFGGAALLLGANGDAGTAPGGGTPPARAAAPAPGPATSAPPAPAPAAPGVLREGDSGPEVSELQQRLLRIPDVYRDGATDGRYDTALTAAVARFQLWYGIRGDESGVYGDDTRLALESRTPAVAG